MYTNCNSKHVITRLMTTASTARFDPTGHGEILSDIKE